MDEKLLDKKAAASLLDMTVRAVDDWMRRGWLRYVKQANGRVRFRRRDVIEAREGGNDRKDDPMMG